MMPCDDASTKPQAARRLEVFTGAGRRRRWSEADKVAIVAESYASPETVSDIARRHGLASGQLFAWRRLHRPSADDAVLPAATPLFVPALVEALPAPVAAAAAAPRSVKRARKRRAAPMVEVVIDGTSVEIAYGADATVIAAVLDALKTPR